MDNFQEGSNEPNDLNINPSRRRHGHKAASRPHKAGRGWMIATIILGVIVACVVSGFLFIGIIVSSLGNLDLGKSKSTVTVKDNTILKLNLDNVSEVPQRTAFSAFFEKASTPTFYELLAGIERAATDPRIKGIYYDGSGYIGGAMATELHAALEKFKESGKFIYSYLETSDKTGYFIATASDTIFVSDEGVFLMQGFGMSTMFYKGLYDKIGLDFTVVQCEDYKTAAEPYKNYKFSDSARVAYQALLQQREAEFISTIQAQRGLSKEDIVKIMDAGLLSSDDMLENSLADLRASKSQILAFLQAKASSEELTQNRLNEIFNPTLPAKDIAKEDKSAKDESGFASAADFEDDNIININDYISTLEGYLEVTSTDTTSAETAVGGSGAEKIAIICGEGAITSDRADAWFADPSGLAASEFVPMLEDAENDPEIKGIIIRINSPGGSVLASEEIYQAILKARRKKPVYASMSNMAASGGYYMAMGCDTIIAHANTITGSIGVVSAIPNFSKTLNKLGINYDTISTGTGNPFFIDPMLPIKTADADKFKAQTFKTYQRFLSKVAKSRNKSVEEIRAVAKGRVWTGEDALKHGLVDVIGNLPLAIKLMKNRIKNENAEVVFWPEHENQYTALKRMFSEMSYKTIISNLVFSNAYFADKEGGILGRLNYLNVLSSIASKEKVLMAMPDIRIE